MVRCSRVESSGVERAKPAPLRPSRALLEGPCVTCHMQPVALCMEPVAPCDM
jgi:hypothetical protein